MLMARRGTGLVLCVLLAGAGGPAEAQSLARSAALRRALSQGDLAGVRAAVAEERSALGERAGVPEVADTYTPVPADAAVFSAAEARQAFAPFFAAVEKDRWWRVGADPTKLTAPLRLPASVMTGYVVGWRAGLPGAEEGLARAGEAADFLMWAQEQAGRGLFPFPAARGTSKVRAMEVATRFLEDAERAGRLGQVVRAGWLFDDLGDGGLQFDNGECGEALLDLYAASGDARYLRSALRAAEWAVGCPLCANWNYNSFSVGLLARAYEATREVRFLEAAVKKARLGVLPGQMPDGPRAGRWVDPHNARPAYHYIMMRELARLAAALPVDDPFRGEVVQALRLGLRARNAEIVTRGIMTRNKAFEALMLVCRTFASDPDFIKETRSSEALQALCAHVSDEARKGRRPLSPGEWGLFLEYCAGGGRLRSRGE